MIYFSAIFLKLLFPYFRFWKLEIKIKSVHTELDFFAFYFYYYYYYFIIVVTVRKLSILASLCSPENHLYSILAKKKCRNYTLCPQTVYNLKYCQQQQKGLKSTAEERGWQASNKRNKLCRVDFNKNRVLIREGFGEREEENSCNKTISGGSLHQHKLGQAVGN